MKEKMYLLKMECTACFRQLSESMHCSTLEAVILTAFLLIISGAFSWFNASGELTNLFFAGWALISVIIGFTAIRKKNIQDLLAGKQFQAYTALPVNAGLLAALKTEKYLIGSLFTYLLINMYLHGIFLLGGISFIKILPSFIICTILFSLFQNIRMLLLCSGNLLKRTFRIALFLLIGLLFIYRDALTTETILEKCFGFANIYVQYMPFTSVLSALLLITIKTVFKPSRPVSAKEEAEQELPVPAFLEPVLAKFDYVFRKDLYDSLHTKQKRNSLLRKTISLIGLPALICILVRTNTIPVTGSQSFLLMICISLTPISLAGMFEMQMTMGYEGKMILYYLLSGSSVADIQQRRIRTLSKLSILFTSVTAIVCGILLGSDLLQILKALLLNVLFGTCLLYINGYYALKNTKYLNDMSVPDMASHLTGQILTTCMEFLLFAPSALAESSMLENYSNIIWFAGIAMILLVTVHYRVKLRKGDKYFYGEYQEAM